MDGHLYDLKMAEASSSCLLTDLNGAPLSPGLCARALGRDGEGVACEIVPGTELRQAGSHSALLRDARDAAAPSSSLVFLKKVTASFVAHKPWNDRRRVLLYIRNEQRFYAEFADELRARRVGIPAARLHVAAGLDGIEELEDEPPAARLEGAGAMLFIEPLADGRFEQLSPLSPRQARHVLAAAARLHAAAWEARAVLQRGATRLQRHGGSFALAARNPKELQGLPASWERFVAAFTPAAPPGFFARPQIASLGRRLAAAAVWVAARLSPSPLDAHATLVHGDLKAMNVFLPTCEGGEAVLIDFASTGVGFGVADVALHLVHALSPADLDGGGEEALLDSYLDALAAARGGAADAAPYPRSLALRHYQLATIDYGRFMVGRFWGSASPASFAAKAGNENIALPNRDLGSALRFVERLSACLAALEPEIS